MSCPPNQKCSSTYIPINNPCKIYPDAKCVVYSGNNLSPSGINNGDRLETIIIKLNNALTSTVPGLDRTYYTSDFTTATDCPDTSLNGKRFRLIYRGFGKLIKDVEWTYLAGGGFRILLPSFDVTLDPNNIFQLEFY